jgi:hypothetical protein
MLWKLTEGGEWERKKKLTLKSKKAGEAFSKGATTRVKSGNGGFLDTFRVILAASFAMLPSMAPVERFAGSCSTKVSLR